MEGGIKQDIWKNSPLLFFLFSARAGQQLPLVLAVGCGVSPWPKNVVNTKVLLRCRWIEFKSKNYAIKNYQRMIIDLMQLS
jgi:hypothetical protein